MTDFSHYIYIGSYSEPDTHGLHVLGFGKDGSLKKIGGVSGIRNPSFLDIAPTEDRLCAVSESGGSGTERGDGGIAVYAIDHMSGALRLTGSAPTGGPGLCHVAISPGNECAVTASYSGGNLAVIPFGPGGLPDERSCFIQHEGSGPNAKRQEKAHAHSVTFSPDGRYVYACDLGMDKIMIYEIDTEKGILTPADPPSVSANPGAGPRHFTFSPSAHVAYCINELDSTITAYRHDPASGALDPLETYPTLPENFTENSTCADIHFHPSGRTLYGSNRGHDSIAVFDADPATGRLSARGHVHTGGKTPRNFGLDPAGEYLLAANQDSDNIVVFAVDPKDGGLSPTGKEITNIPKPVCVRFVKAG